MASSDKKCTGYAASIRLQGKEIYWMHSGDIVAFFIAFFCCLPQSSLSLFLVTHNVQCQPYGCYKFDGAHISCAQTAQPAAESSPSMWLVRPAGLPAATAFDPQQPQDAAAPPSAGAGVPVKCGSIISLEHVGSHALLRTGQSEAPLSSNHEVQGCWKL